MSRTFSFSSVLISISVKVTSKYEVESRSIAYFLDCTITDEYRDELKSNSSSKKVGYRNSRCKVSRFTRLELEIQN